MPFFSVVIPTFNSAERVVKAIRSVLGQTCDDFEILVMDDGSSDATADVVAALGDARIRYGWSANSGGPATPRNRGMASSTGEWICFLDADDVWYPAKLERVKSEIDRLGNIDVVCHWELQRVAGRDDATVLRHGPYESDFYRVLLTGGNRISTSATCVRKGFVKRENLTFNESPDYVIVEDYDFWMNLARLGAKFAFIEEVLGEYVLEGGNISANRPRYFHNLEVMLTHHVYQVQCFSAPELLWGGIQAQIDLSKVKSHFVAGDLVEGLLLAMRVARRHPAMVAKKLSDLLKFKKSIPR